MKDDIVGRGLGGFGYLGDLAAASASPAYLTLERGALFRTADGGRTWQVWQSQLGSGVYASIESGHHWRCLRC